MDNMSKVIFFCLAVITTLLIYQNNQLKDDVELLLSFADTQTGSNNDNKTINEQLLDDINRLDAFLPYLQKDVVKNQNAIEKLNNDLTEIIGVNDVGNTKLTNLVGQVFENTKDIAKNKQNINAVSGEVKSEIKSTADIERIIERCRAFSGGYAGAHAHLLRC